MSAFNAALNFGKDMIELGVSTLGTLAEIQLGDLTTFLERQSDVVGRTGDLRDFAGLVSLQREYRETFFADRRKALAATTGALRAASRQAAKSWTERARERSSPVARIDSKPVSETSKRSRRRSKTIKDPSAQTKTAATKASVDATAAAPTKARTRKRP